jgi:urocanate hydratase
MSRPDVITDQTAAHDVEFGYIPARLTIEQAKILRETDPTAYKQGVLDSISVQVRTMLEWQQREVLSLTMATIFDNERSITA